MRYVIVSVAYNCSRIAEFRCRAVDNDEQYRIVFSRASLSGRAPESAVFGAKVHSLLFIAAAHPESPNCALNLPAHILRRLSFISDFRLTNNDLNCGINLQSFVDGHCC